jgi:hypothetical protein
LASRFQTGTAPATAIVAAIGAILIGYINTFDSINAWHLVKTQAGFRMLLDEISTESEVRKRFIALERVLDRPKDWRVF